MQQIIKTAVVGMDTSHAVEFPKFIQDPALPAENQVKGMQVTRALRFETPFQNRDGLDKRQAYLESIGVTVTEDFDEAVADCDAIFIEINDPALHLEYFKKCAVLGKPIFLDKPFAATLDETLEILKIAKAEGYSLSDEELEAISGGLSAWDEHEFCPKCQVRFRRQEGKDWQKCPVCGEVYLRPLD